MNTVKQTVTDWLARRRSAAAIAPIGLDFASHQLNLVQLTAGAGGPGLRAATARAYPCSRAELLSDRRALRTFVDQTLASAPFAGRRVVSALAPAEVRILPLTIHAPAGSSEAQAVARAVREQLGEEAGDCVVDYYHVRGAEAGAGTEKQVLVAVARERQVIEYLECLRTAGLEAVALDIGPAAIARLLAAMHRGDYQQAVLLINFGVARSFLTVIWGRRLMLDREIDFGEQQLVTKLAQALMLAPDTALALLREHGVGSQAGDAGTGDIGRVIGEILYPEFAALSEELLRTQIYVASRTRGNTVSRVYLNGSAARYADIQARIGKLVNLPVEVLDPLKAFACPAGFDAPHGVSHGIALAAGLALREIRLG